MQKKCVKKEDRIPVDERCLTGEEESPISKSPPRSRSNGEEAGGVDRAGPNE